MRKKETTFVEIRAESPEEGAATVAATTAGLVLQGFWAVKALHDAGLEPVKVGGVSLDQFFNFDMDDLEEFARALALGLGERAGHGHFEVSTAGEDVTASDGGLHDGRAA